jgi:MFS family permease
MFQGLNIHYGWAIVGFSVLSVTLINGIRNSFSVFFPYILNEFGWSRGSTSIMLSLNIVLYGLLAPVAGSLGDRWKPRSVILIGIIVLGVATASCGFAYKLWQLYLVFGVFVPLGMAFSGWPLLAPAISNWFDRRRGLAMGIGQVGIGLSFAYGLFAEFAISLVGWRYAYFVLAGVVAAFLIPIFLSVFQYRPEDRGMLAYGNEESPKVKGISGKKNYKEGGKYPDWTLRSAMKSYQLWLLVLSFFLSWGIGACLVLAHQVKFAVDMGYSSVFAASVFALFGLFMVVGQLCSSISDRIGREITVFFATILTISALAALVLVKDITKPWLLYLYAICFGCGAGIYAPTVFVGTADIFHGRYYGTIAGLLLTGMGVGGGIGPWLGGYIFDVSGSYSLGFLLCMVFFAMACLAFFIAAPRNAVSLRARFGIETD